MGAGQVGGEDPQQALAEGQAAGLQWVFDGAVGDDGVQFSISRRSSSSECSGADARFNARRLAGGGPGAGAGDWPGPRPARRPCSAPCAWSPANSAAVPSTAPRQAPGVAYNRRLRATTRKVPFAIEQGYAELSFEFAQAVVMFDGTQCNCS